MSYQRMTEGDAYVIACDHGFWCVSCEYYGSRTRTYGGIIHHLETYHKDSDKALRQLRIEAEAVGLDANFDEYWDKVDGPAYKAKFGEGK